MRPSRNARSRRASLRVRMVTPAESDARPRAPDPRQVGVLDVLGDRRFPPPPGDEVTRQVRAGLVARPELPTQLLPSVNEAETKRRRESTARAGAAHPRTRRGRGPPPPHPRHCSFVRQLLQYANDQPSQVVRPGDDVPNPSTGRVRTSRRESFLVTLQPPQKPCKSPDKSPSVASSRSASRRFRSQAGPMLLLVGQQLIVQAAPSSREAQLRSSGRPGS